jgi:kynureninase
MVAVEPGVAMIAEAGLPAIRAKSVALTDFAVQLYDELLAPLGCTLASPRAAALRGSHITVSHPDAEELTGKLIADGVIPDFRRPDGIRIGLAPLTTRFAEVYDGLTRLVELVTSQ